jgi:hypothetical protein
MSNHFHLTLPSNSSLDSYPQNTVARFTVKLPETIQLDGDFEFGLAEIIYPHSWYNLNNLTRQYWIGVKSEGRDIRQYYVKSGFYLDGTVLANELTKQCAKAFSDIVDFSVKFGYNSITNKFSVETKGSQNALFMSSELQKILGIVIGTNPIGNQVVIATDVFDLNRSLNFIYVYCDVASYSIVGGVKAPLLRVCNVNGRNNEIHRTIYTHPHYVPVARKEFNCIEIFLSDELGQPFPFLFGKSVVTLHFRRRHSLLAAS